MQTQSTRRHRNTLTPTAAAELATEEGRIFIGGSTSVVGEAL